MEIVDNDMKAMVLDKFNEPLKCKKLPVPVPAVGEVLIKVKAVGVCATDLKIQTGKIEGIKMPLIPGHEVAGEVVKLGDKVADFTLGDRVVAYIYNSCGECEYCIQELPALCPNTERIGIDRDGGFAEYAVWPAKCLVKIPDSLEYQKACVVTDAVATAYHALCDRIKVEEGDSVLIMGAGGLGIHAVQIAKAKGAKVIVTDIDDTKLQMARSCGADYAFNSNEVDLKLECKKLTNGRGVKYSADFVGLPAVSKLAFECLAPAGKQVQPGYSFGGQFEVNYMVLVSGERSIIASRAMTKQNIIDSLEMVAKGEVIPEIDKTAVVPLEKANEVLERLKDGKILGRAVLITE